MSSLSVIVCTYNPDPNILIRCLNSIASASLIHKPQEIIIIDNNSATALMGQKFVIDFLLKNENAKLIVEPRQGLTQARLRGIQESTGELLVFVDDDNFVHCDFFKEGVNIADKYTLIGAYSGQIDLEFESIPEDWTKKYWGLLVYRRISRDQWSNLIDNGDTMPCGAGLFIKREVAEHYLTLHIQGKRYFQMDRSGSSLLSGGDNDLALCACDIGLGIGIFKDIHLTHYIPKKRTTLKYLLNLAKAVSMSSVILNSFRGISPTEYAFKTQLKNFLSFLAMDPIAKKFYISVRKGEKEGVKLLNQMQSSNKY